VRRYGNIRAILGGWTQQQLSAPLTYTGLLLIKFQLKFRPQHVRKRLTTYLTFIGKTVLLRMYTVFTPAKKSRHSKNNLIPTSYPIRGCRLLGSKAQQACVLERFTYLVPRTCKLDHANGPILILAFVVQSGLYLRGRRRGGQVRYAPPPAG